VRGLNFQEFLSRARHRCSSLLLDFMPIWLLRRVFPESILCLCYHIVSDVPVPHVKHYKFLGTAQFEQDLNYLESRFQYVTYEQIVESRSQTTKRPDAAVCLTFDDGFAECLSVVRPILLRRGATCIFFIITDLIDNHAAFFETRASLCVDAVLRHPVGEVEAIFRELGLQSELRIAKEIYRNSVPKQMARYWGQFEERVRPMLVWLLMTGPDDAELVDQLCRRLRVDVEGYVEKQRPYLSKEQILRLRSDGFTIGAHGCSHHRLQSLSVEQAEREIVQSCRIIRDLTGQASVPFAFPYFGGGLDRRWLARLREQHPFVGLFFDTQGQCRDEPIVVQRIFGERINETGSMGRLLRRAWLRRFSRRELYSEGRVPGDGVAQ
jgi:peptidoglycan/xylan/chitin deacetylase (PgdA/CDA1 family)